SYQRRPRHEVALVYYLWGLLWWLGGLVHEITRFFPYRTEVDALLVLAAVSYQRRPRHEVALVYYLWGLLWWLGGLVHEITRF
ncbi:hypothetical protein C7E12_21705, partial [Stenotrophomonas maltophilia]